MPSSLIGPFRAVLVLIAFGTLVLQAIVMPELAREAAVGDSRLRPAVVPYAIAGILLVACVQVVLTSTWMLLRRVQHDAIFERNALRWVDAIVVAVVVATTLVAGVAVHILGVIGTGGPGVVLALGGLLVVGVAATLLMLVMRGLLVGATGLRTELAAVV